MRFENVPILTDGESFCERQEFPDEFMDTLPKIFHFSFNALSWVSRGKRFFSKDYNTYRKTEIGLFEPIPSNELARVYLVRNEQICSFLVDRESLESHFVSLPENPNSFYDSSNDRIYLFHGQLCLKDYSIKGYSWSSYPSGSGYGIEIEVRTGQETEEEESTSEIDELSYIFNGSPDSLGVVKTDGSLDSDGCELVLFHKPLKTIRESLAFASNKLNYLGFRGWQAGYGVHIHVSRSKVRNIDHIRELVYRNRTVFENLSGRRGNSYCVYDRIQSHYECISRSKHGTYEFRMFQSTTNLQSLQGYVSLVACLVKIGRIKGSLEDFLQMLKKDKYGKVLIEQRLEKRPKF